jgi:hypothetical protein
MSARPGESKYASPPTLPPTQRPQAAADGAIYQAIFQVGDPRPDHHWALDGSMHELAIGKSRVMVRIEDDADRIRDL